MVFLGVAFAFGCLTFGLVVVRSSVRCMISRQYLVQLTSLGCGVSTLLFSLAHHFDGYALYAWVYGLCCGGYTYSLRMYTYEQVTIKLAERTAGYVTFVQGLPVLFGVPLARKYSLIKQSFFLTLCTFVSFPEEGFFLYLFIFILFYYLSLSLSLSLSAFLFKLPQSRTAAD